MALGNCLGVAVGDRIDADLLFDTPSGSIVAEVIGDVPGACLLGYVTDDPKITYGQEHVGLKELEALWEGCLENVFPTSADSPGHAEQISYPARPALVAGSRFAKPGPLSQRSPEQTASSTRRAPSRSPAAYRI